MAGDFAVIWPMKSNSVEFLLWQQDPFVIGLMFIEYSAYNMWLCQIFPKVLCLEYLKLWFCYLWNKFFLEQAPETFKQKAPGYSFIVV